MKRKKTDNISYIAPDGKKFRDLKEYMDYAATKFHDGKVVPGSVAQLFMSLRRYQVNGYILKSDTEKGSKHAPLKLPTTN